MIQAEGSISDYGNFPCIFFVGQAETVLGGRQLRIPGRRILSTIERDLLKRTDLENALRRSEIEVADLKARLAEWEERYDALPKRDASFSTVSGREVKPLYTELDHSRAHKPIGYPGMYPFTRGPYATMYTTPLWTMRQLAGFAPAEETNQRYK